MNPPNKTPRQKIAAIYEDYTSLNYTLTEIGKRNGVEPYVVGRLITKHFTKKPNSGMRYILTLESRV